MATMTPAATKTVSAIEALADDSLTLRYTDGTKDELKLADVVAAVPAAYEAGTQSDDLALLYIQPAPEPAASDDAEDPPSARPFAGHLAVRRLPQACVGPLKRYVLHRLPQHLDVSQDRQFHIVVSIRSGACDAEAFFERIVQPVLSHLGFPKESERHQSYEVHFTSGNSSVSELAAQVIGPRANRGICQTILLLSGDGGAVDTINGVCSATRSPGYVKPVIGLLALGTGNALANSSGLNDDFTKGLSGFLLGSPKPLPVFKARFSPGSEILSNQGRDASVLPLKDADGSGIIYGVVVASWALHASLVGDSDTAEYRKHGAARFVMAAEELLAPRDGAESHVYKGKVLAYQRTGAGAEFPTHWERREHMYILATFVSRLERTLTISPRSKPLDKTLRLLHWGKLDSRDVMDIFAMAYDGGGHTELDVVGYETIEGLRIDFEEKEARWRRVCIDGKIVRVNEGGWVEIRKHNEELIDLVTAAA